MKSKANIQAKTEKLKEGIFLGARFKSDEIIVGTETGVLKARTLTRLTEDKQWDWEYLRNLQGTPRQPDPKVVSDQIHASLRDRAEPEQGVPAPVPGQPAEVPVAPEVNQPRPEAAARRMCVRKPEMEKYGPTQRLPGLHSCRTWHECDAHGGLQRPHEEAHGGGRGRKKAVEAGLGADGQALRASDREGSRE